MKASLLAALSLVGLLGAPLTHAAEPVYPFFAFCMDTHDSQHRTLQQQAELLKELGYDGAGHLWTKQVKERLETLDAVGLKLYQISIQVTLSKEKDPYDPQLKDVLPLLKGRNVMINLLMNGGKPSDTALDARAVGIIKEIAEMAEPSGTRIVLYPHSNDWLERVEDAVRLAKQVNRPNVGVMFNLCHWLKVDNEDTLKPLLTAAMPYLMAVSIHGADHAADIHAGTGNWIQPLGSGSYDVLAFMKTLKELGYKGPVGLQCWGIEGDARDHLTKSIAAWKKIAGELNAPTAP